tara:strand:+ start:197 stop:652 length:456 start_codon:yes stop_codon:yes gene_type:complete
MQKQITVSQILEDLENGMTRTPSDKRYNSEVGSIMEKYNLTKYEVTLLFKNEKLKGKKTKQPKELSFVLVDDTETTENVVEEPSPEIIEAGNSLAKKLNVGILEDSEVEETTEEVQEVEQFSEVVEEFNNIHDATVTTEATEEENNDQLGW